MSSTSIIGPGTMARSQYGDSLAGKIIVDMSNPFDPPLVPVKG